MVFSGVRWLLIMVLCGPCVAWAVHFESLLPTDKEGGYQAVLGGDHLLSRQAKLTFWVDEQQVKPTMREVAGKLQVTFSEVPATAKVIRAGWL